MSKDILNRIEFVLPDFTRFAWVNDKAEETWSPNISSIIRAFDQIENLSIISGVRDCRLTVINPQDLVQFGYEQNQQGLVVLPLALEGATNQPYTSRAKSAVSGEPFNYRVVVGRSENAMRFQQAWHDNDNNIIGQLLGYPDCCRSFFQRVWVENQMVDTTWPMAAGLNDDSDTHVIEVDGPSVANILWRWAGIRAVPHLPCSFTCKKTISFGQTMVKVGRKHGFTQEMDWLLEILSWPVEWSALHGIAEIKTPIVKISTNTDATPNEYKVYYRGLPGAYPKEGARGLDFPYKHDEASIGRRRRRTIKKKLDAESKEWLYEDNGFSSLVSMRNAHQSISEELQVAIGNRTMSVLDLGCGNGELLRQLSRLAPNVIPYGVDTNATNIRHSKQLHPKHKNNFMVASIFDCHLQWPEKKFDVAIFMPGRLIENNHQESNELLTFLQSRVDIVLVYAYGDWLDSFGSIYALAEAAGMKVSQPSEKKNFAWVEEIM